MTLPMSADAPADQTTVTRPGAPADGDVAATLAMSDTGDAVAANAAGTQVSPGRLPIVPRKHYGSAREVARGGLGRVSAVMDLRLGREVAIKELHEDRSSVRARFLREVLITARLEHPSIIPVYEAGRWPDGSPFYAMKLISGRTLSDLLDAAPRFHDRLSHLSSAIAVVDAISYAHSKGVIHRDLKPSNVIVGEFGETVVVDWGLAKLLGEDERALLDSAGNIRHDSGGDLTMAGTILGTPRYMAPEQAAGDDVDERADIYALGSILYHLCAGEAPHQGASPREVLYRLMLEPPAPLAQRAPEVPQELVTIVDKAMARKPGDRYASARALADDLRRFQNGQRVSVHRYSLGALIRRWLHRHRALVAVAASLLALLLLTAVLSVWRIIEESELASARYVEAQAARERETARNHDLIVAQASREQDATATVAWLKHLPRSAATWPLARLVATEARNRGIARHVWRDHESVVYRMHLSPDGKLLASASQDRTAALRDLSTGRMIRLRGHGDWVHYAVFSPTRPMLATSSRDGTVRLWRSDGTLLQVIDDHAGVAVDWLAFSPDGVHLATGDDAGKIRLRNLDTGDSRTLAGHAGAVWSLAFSPDGRWLASASYAGDVRMWSMSGDVPHRTLPSHAARVRQVCFSADGRWLASVSQDRTVRLWDVASGSLAATLQHSAGVMHASFSPDGLSLLSADSDGAIRIWDIASKQGRLLGQHTGMAHWVEPSPDGRLVASSGTDGKVRVWDPITGLERRTYVGSRDQVTQVMFSPDGASLYSLGRSSGIREWPLAWHTMQRLSWPGEGGYAVAFSPDGATIAVGHETGDVVLWDIDAGRGVEIAHHDGLVAGVAFSPDGAWIVSGGRDGKVLLHDRASGATRLVGTHRGWLTGLAFVPGTRTLVTSSSDGTLGSWHLEDGRRTSLEGHQGAVRSMAVASDGAVASAGDDGSVRLWDLATGTSQVLARREGPVRFVTFSPDGAHIAFVDGEKQIHVQHRGTGATQVLTGHRHEVVEVAFSRDGSHLVSLGKGANDVLVWNLALGSSRRLLIEQTWGMVWSGDGERLVTSSEDATVRLWDADSGRGHVIDQHPMRPADAVAISLDGTVIATVDRHGELHIWRDDLPSDPAAVADWLQQITSAEISLDSYLATPAAPAARQ